MKKFKKIALLFALVLLIGCLFVACNENTKQKAVETNNNYPIVSSNGGMAVQYGNYLYFVNGYAGSTALNTFGSVQTGAVCRIEIDKDEDGNLYYKPSTFTVIVPKNVYGTDTTNAGIYIADGYVYYHTTSVDKNSKREYKTDEGVLMRTSLDGSKTEQIKAFSDNATVFRVSGNYIVYTSTDDDGYSHLNAIKLSDLSETVIESENVLAYNFSDNYVVYTTYNTARVSNYTSDYLVKMFDFKTGATTLLLSSDIYNTGKTGITYLYTTTVKSVQETDNAVYLFYTKDDNSTNDINTGYYCCFFIKSNPVYDAANEYRLTYQTSSTTYDRFFRLKNGWLLAYHDKVFDVYGPDYTRKAGEEPEENGAFMTYTLTGASDLVDVYENDTEVYAYFTTSSDLDGTSYTALNYIKLFDKTETGYEVAEENVAVFFYFNYKSTYTTYEVTDVHYYEANGTTDAKAVFYLNSDLGDNAFACYHVIQNGNDKKDADEAEGKILGNIEQDKLVDLISSGKVEEDE